VVPLPNFGAAAADSTFTKPESINCEAFYSLLNRSYAIKPQGKQHNSQIRENLRTINARLAAPAGYTPQEARNYFEATGGNYLSRSDGDMENVEMDKKELLKIVREGESLYWSAALHAGIGAWSCLQHAELLKEFLETKTNFRNYTFEIVNGWSNPRKASAGNFLWLNHYLVRAVSLRTGHSYICDGYIRSSVVHEKNSEYVLFNEFEESIYNQYVKMTSSFNTFVPLKKGYAALRAKYGAGVCLSGADSWRLDSPY